jgi:hypothetical protein
MIVQMSSPALWRSIWPQSHTVWLLSCNDNPRKMFSSCVHHFRCWSTVSFTGLIWLIDWLIDYLRFYVPLKNFSLIWRRHHCRWRAAKFRPMLGALGLWAERDLYRATPSVTRNLGFSGLIRRTTPFSRL